MEAAIFCNDEDQIAYALHGECTRQKLPVSLVTWSQLIFAGEWVQEISGTGRARTKVALLNGTLLDSQKLAAAFHRVRYFPVNHFVREGDRRYAQNEFSALYYSFLKSLGNRLVYPLQTCDLSDFGDNRVFLMQQAILAGLPVADYLFTTSPKWKGPLPRQVKGVAGPAGGEANQTLRLNRPGHFFFDNSNTKKVWVVGEDVFCLRQKEYAKNLVLLARRLNKVLLEVEVCDSSKGFKVCNLSVFPLQAPPVVISALARLFSIKINQT